MRIVDTHAHLHFSHFKGDLEHLVGRFSSDGIEFVINVGIDVDDSTESLNLASKFSSIFCSVGVHPHEASKVERDYIQKLKKLAESPKVIAIGETGLDYYRNFSSKEDQKRVFQEQLLLAKELDLPVIIHIRDAYEDAYEMISKIGLPNAGGVIHAFSADTSWALKFIEMGCFIGIGGPLTYPKNISLKNVVRAIGIENIVTETDCPYLPPQQFRGKRNEPAYVRFVVEEISRILNEDPKEISTQLLQNARELFSINQ
ncbi:TatD family hydrolase [Thermotoga profunda]|uniref:TatD family hydrolase n=1 Tax=Thermotoga profunda TaxID=1508420 RepID=UPI0005976492|nr:TatD family hydrolase [Thermotoga profunda]